MEVNHRTYKLIRVEGRCWNVFFLTSLSCKGKLNGISSHTTEGIYDQLRVPETVLHSESDVLRDPLWRH